MEEKTENKKQKKSKKKRTKCEVYSRVVGYLRPVGQWNEGKQAEWDDRKTFKVAA
tara:strand:- start:166 stop:330 length:165 start_codon:yes stop_codon:yes gene_type:complete